MALGLPVDYAPGAFPATPGEVSAAACPAGVFDLWHRARTDRLAADGLALLRRPSRVGRWSKIARRVGIAFGAFVIAWLAVSLVAGWLFGSGNFLVWVFAAVVGAVVSTSRSCDEIGASASACNVPAGLTSSPVQGW